MLKMLTTDSVCLTHNNSDKTQKNILYLLLLVFTDKNYLKNRLKKLLRILMS